MTLTAVKPVVIEIDSIRKYIVAILVSDTDEEMMVVRSYNLSFHASMYNQLIIELNQSGIRLKHVHRIGGGYVKSESKERRIILYGKSSDYGPEPNRDETIKMFQESYPDYQIEKRSIALTEV